MPYHFAKIGYQHYVDSFRGLSPSVWWLSLVTLINRAGTMVIPFLSLYLTHQLGFTLEQTGWILSAFGLGSLVGTWLGGKLTDRIGYYKVMLFSLVFSGIFFLLLQLFTTFWSICFGVFAVMVLADMFRPAVFVALSAYSKPENKTRSVTLIRLAINLGFSVGPTLGGLIITRLGYPGLFWVDGITCILAGLLLLKVLHPRKNKVLDPIENPDPVSVYKDRSYLYFLVAMVLFGFIFLQYFSTIPLFYKEYHHLSEDQIGLLMGLNGFLIFLLEMPLIKFFEKGRGTVIQLIQAGLILLLLSFLVLNISDWIGYVIIGMILMSFGEMLTFPFSNALALNRSRRGKAGEYMALYSITFSIGHIFGHNGGMQLISNFGFQTTWSIMIAMGLLSMGLLYFLRNRL